jgi:hypothetical protein
VELSFSSTLPVCLSFFVPGHWIALPLPLYQNITISSDTFVTEVLKCSKTCSLFTEGVHLLKVYVAIQVCLKFDLNKWQAIISTYEMEDLIMENTWECHFWVDI